MDKYYDNIKNYLIDNEVYKIVKDYSKNKSDLTTYYNVGKELVSAGKHYGEGIIKKYSEKLTKEVDKKYTRSSLFRMKQFYKVFSNEKVAPLARQLSWSHCIILLTIKDITKINYYINQIIERNLSKRQLQDIIKNKEYERLPIETKNKIKNYNNNNEVIDYIKNPILIKNSTNNKEISEKVLQKLILEDIESFMKELGNSFCFISSEYKIKVDNFYNFIDILLYNIEFNCYVVIELKTTELKKEHIGQIQVYMNYIDNNLKKVNQDKTIGIIICKKNRKFVIEYCSDRRIISREYELV